MYYLLHELTHAALSPWRAAADVAKLYYKNPLNPMAHTAYGKNVAAGCELFERTTRRYGKPSFDLPQTNVGGGHVAVNENVVWKKPFCNLIHFERDIPKKVRKDDPKLLIVAPMSGHYATLLRGTVEAMLPKHEVYVTDWVDARMVPLSDGSFDLDDYVDYIISILHFLGDNVHVMAVCQPSVPVMAAVSRMEEDGDPFAPASMTLMGGPIDTRINPTEVNKMAENRPIEWFERNVIMKVPYPQPGFLRSVYPGFFQLSGFMGMNLDKHVEAHREFFSHLVDGDGDSAEKHRDFYDEYMAVMDLTEEFYLQTVDVVFINHALPKGNMMHRGKAVDPSKVTKCALLTVEGEMDDISGVGQTKAAHDLCCNLPDSKRAHYVQPNVGHYGVFNGSRFRAEIAPRIADFILTHNRGHHDEAPEPIKAQKNNEAPASQPKRQEPVQLVLEPKAAPEPKAEKSAKPKAEAKGKSTAANNPVKAKKPKSIVLTEPEGVRDDLKSIAGIGPKLETILNENGIFHYWQISSLTPGQVEELDAKLSFKGRIMREDWIGQAKRLAKETA